MKKLFMLVFVGCLVISFSGCISDNTSPQISPMSLSSSQQEIVNLIAHTNKEVLLFDYSLGGQFNTMEIWVEVYHYGELVKETSRLHMLGNSEVSLNDGQLSIVISQYENNEFRWTISVMGARSTSQSWFADSNYMARSFGAITDTISIVDNQDIVLYVSKFTTRSSLRSPNDLQEYLNTDLFAGYTYVHIIKARFSTAAV